MKIDVRPRKRNAPRPADKHAPGFLQWLRGRECVFSKIDGDRCEGKIEAMHLDWAGGKGMGTKVADRYALPSCAGHHSRQHSQGWNTFMARLELTKTVMKEAAERFWMRWPGRVKWERDNG